jgi:RNA polymerase sigma-70 factor (ECF subfamily)
MPVATRHWCDGSLSAAGRDRKDVTVDERAALTMRFEEHRPHLRAVGYRMLGSLTEAEDAVQETWLRFSRTDPSGIANLGGWLTTVIARVCLDMLRSRKARREDSVGAHVPDPIVTPDGGLDPEHQALLANAVGIALIVVLETLEPAERLAFVLHDMFAVPFDEIADIVGRSPTATRQLASRARRRVQDAAPTPDVDLARQREVVNAFLAASRRGDVEALLAVLDPDVVLRGDRGPGDPAASRIVRGAKDVSKGVVFGARRAGEARIERPVLINGAAGILVLADGQPFSVVAFTVRAGRIVEINVLADPERLRQLDLTLLDPGERA